MAIVLDEFKQAIGAGGLHRALRWLNATVPYRYTAIFRFDGDMLRNVCLADKRQADITSCPDQPIMDSYCIYIHRSREPFRVEEAAQDRRVDGHPKQSSYQCYYGIPLFGPGGALLGTVCHFDVAPVDVTDDVVTALDDLAPLISEAAFGVGRRSS